MFTCNLKIGSKSINEKVYVVKIQEEALLGVPAIFGFGLIEIKKIGKIKAFRSNIKRRYPELFSGVGKLPEKYHIELVKDAVPYSHKVSRKILIPLHSKELNRLQSKKSKNH